MKHIVFLLFVLAAPALSSQTVELVGLPQPAAAPVQPGTPNHEVLVMRLYKNTGSAASNMTQLKVKLSGTATSADWTAVDLYYDADRSRTVNGGDSLLGTATVTTAGKVTFSGLNEPIQDGFYNGRDYLAVVDVDGAAVPGNTFVFEATDVDVTVSAGAVSAPFGAVVSNTHTIRIDSGAEIDVRQASVSIPSSTTAVYDVGYVPTSGGNLTFTVWNTGTGTLSLTGSPLVEITFMNNCTATVTTQPSASIGVSSSSNFVIAVDPVNPTAFAFTFRIENNDFDEFPYTVNCGGSATPLPEISIEHLATPVADGATITLGSYTAGLVATMNLTIYNTGPAALNLTGTPLVDFPAQNNVSCTLQTPPVTPVAATSGSTTFTVAFVPAGSGSWTFTIWIENDDANENPYNITVDGSSPPVTPTKLGVFRDPANASATLAFGTQPVVSVQDNNGAVNTSDNSTVIVASITPATGTPGAVLGGTLTATCVNGYATFGNLSINLEGTGYTLTFTHQLGSLSPATSGAFDVGPAPPSPPKDNKDDGGGGCSSGAPGFNWLACCALLALLCVALRKPKYS